MKERTRAIIVTAFGALIFLGCIITGAVILNQAPSALQKASQIPIEGEDGYEVFLDSRNSDAPPLYYEYYIFDIKNAVAIGNAATFADVPVPEVKKRGPYTYREYCTRHNLYYRDDGKTANIAVDYNELCWKEFVPSLSIAADGTQNKESDEVTLPYFQYYGVARTAGVLATPNAPLMKGASVLFDKLFTFLGLFSETLNRAKMYEAAVDNTECANASILELFSKCSYKALAQTTGIDPNFDLELGPASKDLFPDGAHAESFVSVFNKLFYCNGETDCYSIRLSTCKNPGSADAPTLCFAYFLRVAQKHIAAPTDVTYQQILNAYWGLSGFGETPSAQVVYFAKYFSNAAGKFFEKVLTEAKAGNTPEDYGKLESNHMFSTKSVRNHILGLEVDPYSAQLGATDTQGSLFSITDCPNTFHAHGPDNRRSFDYNNCLNEWKTRKQSHDRYGQRTGRNDISEVEQITMWRSLDRLPKRDPVARTGFWKAGDVKLVGRRNPNFPSASKHMSKWELNPVVNSDYKAVIFNADTMRDVSFLFNKKSSVRGVKTLQFVPDMANVDPKLAQKQFEVSEYGVFDLTTPKGIPIHLTFCNYMFSIWNTNQNIKKPYLMTPHFERDTVVLEIEPLTGKTIAASFQLLVNLKVAAGATGLSGSIADPAGEQYVVYPLVSMNKHSQLTSENAKDLRKAQNLAFKVPKPTLIVGCVLGPLIMIIGIVLLVKSKRTEVGQFHEQLLINDSINSSL